MSKIFALGAICLLLFVACEKKAEKGDEEGIEQNNKAYIEAFNRQNATAVSSSFTANGIYQTPEETVQGRPELQKKFNQLFSQNKAQMELQDFIVHFPGTGTAIGKATVVIHIPGEPDQKKDLEITYESINGKWLISHLSEVSLTKEMTKSLLQDLGWLVGKWEDKENSSLIEMDASWDKQKNYLTQKFAVTQHGVHTLEGHQVIGWDPVNKQIRSWVFDSDGGFGEGVWRKDGNNWLVEVQFTLPSGLKGSALHIYSNIKPDSYTWESTGREIGGMILPNIEPATVRKK